MGMAEAGGAGPGTYGRPGAARVPLAKGFGTTARWVNAARRWLQGSAGALRSAGGTGPRLSPGRLRVSVRREASLLWPVRHSAAGCLARVAAADTQPLTSRPSAGTLG